MVCMIFGMTNIITVPSLQYHTARAALLPTHGLELLGVLAEAMFVDATLSGLKYNDVLALQILLIGRPLVFSYSVHQFYLLSRCRESTPNCHLAKERESAWLPQC